MRWLRFGGDNYYTVTGLLMDLLMFVSSGWSVKSSQGGMAMGELFMLLHCRRTHAGALGRLAPTDRDALFWLMATTPLQEAMVATGQLTRTPPTTSIRTADPTCSPVHSNPKITKSGSPSTSQVQPIKGWSRSYNQAARRLGPSSTKRDPIALYLLLSVQGSKLTTGYATVMYATFSYHRYVG